MFGEMRSIQTVHFNRTRFHHTGPLLSRREQHY
uniref:Uncharacterized protein n=1 Tax=Anguilla anguilla TaxID=7936 RepID=A0A0E9SRN8_ANGAN